MHHAQTFSGNRYAELRNTDYHLGALILYVLFAGVFILYLYVTSNIWVNLEEMHCSKVNSTDSSHALGVNFQNIFGKLKHAVVNNVGNENHSAQNVSTSRKNHKS